MEVLDWRSILANEYKARRLTISCSYLLVLFVATCSILQPLFLTILVDGFILIKDTKLLNIFRDLFTDSSHYTVLLSFALAMVSLRFAMWLSHCYFSRVFVKVAKSASRRMRLTLLTRLERASLDGIEAVQSGQLVQAIINDVEAVESYLQKITTSLLIALIGIIGTVAVVTWFYWQLGLLLAITNITIVCISRLLSTRVKRLKRWESGAAAHLQSDFLESMSHLRELRASSSDSYFFKRLQHSVDDVYHTSTRLQWITEVISRFSSALHMSGFDLYRIFCVFLILSQSLTLGETLAAINYLWVMISGMNEIINIQYSHQSAVGALTRIQEIQLLQPKNHVPECRYIPKTTDQLTCRAMSFCYPNQSQLLFDNLHFTFGSKEKIAIIGASGSGKSTLISLLLGLQAPNSGHITIAEADVSTLATDSRRQLFSVVLQQTALLNDTIRANLCLDQVITDAQIWRALEIARAAEFVKVTPLALDNKVGNNGLRLSGGERQRIAIARALLRPAHIMIFDEATSALDAETERAVYDNLLTALANKRCIFISHRPAILSLVDRVYLLKDGKIFAQPLYKAHAHSAVSTTNC